VCLPEAVYDRLIPRDEIPSVLVLNGASTALARNALRQAGAPVFLALRYRAAYRPTCCEARVLCPEGARNAPAIPDILVLAGEEGGQIRVSQGSGLECSPERGLAEGVRWRVRTRQARQSELSLSYSQASLPNNG
jgi:hypothetical protein